MQVLWESFVTFSIFSLDIVELLCMHWKNSLTAELILIVDPRTLDPLGPLQFFMELDTSASHGG